MTCVHDARATVRVDTHKLHACARSDFSNYSSPSYSLRTQSSARVPANVAGCGMVIINMGSIVYGFFDEVAEACGDEAEAVAHVAGDVVQTLGLSTREAETSQRRWTRERGAIPKKDRIASPNRVAT